MTPIKRSVFDAVIWPISSLYSSSCVFTVWRHRTLANDPQPISDLDARRRLRSASTCALFVLTTRLFTVGDRAFPVAATRTWNSLPHSVTSSPSLPTFKRLKPLSLTVSEESEIFNGECDAIVDMTLTRPPNEGQGHSFWYQSISHMRLWAVNSNGRNTVAYA